MSHVAGLFNEIPTGASEKQKPPWDPSQVPCRDFARGPCPRGDRCRYKHAAVATSESTDRKSSKSKKPCYNFRNTGECDRKVCPFVHSEASKSKSTAEISKGARRGDMAKLAKEMRELGEEMARLATKSGADGTQPSNSNSSSGSELESAKAATSSKSKGRITMESKMEAPCGARKESSVDRPTPKGASQGSLHSSHRRPRAPRH